MKFETGQKKFIKATLAFTTLQTMINTVPMFDEKVIYADNFWYVNGQHEVNFKRASSTNSSIIDVVLTRWTHLEKNIILYIYSNYVEIT